jgi:hypothetical protein
MLAVEAFTQPLEHDADACYRAVCRSIEERYGGAMPTIMALDGRLAYVCGARFVLEPFSGNRDAIVAAAQQARAGVWLAEVSRHGSVAAPGTTLLGERCDGDLRLAIFAIELPSDAAPSPHP